MGWFLFGFFDEIIQRIIWQILKPIIYV